MDNSIKFVGYSSNGQLKSALKNRENPMDLETFFNAVNQLGNGCGCCKKEGVKVYAVQPVGMPQIELSVLSLCDKCLKSLSTQLEVINIDSNGAPPSLIYSWREV